MIFWGLMAVFEFYRMVAAASRATPLTYFGLTWTLLFIISPFFKDSYITPALLTMAVMLPLVWLLLRPKKEGAFAGWAWTMAGILYIGWLLSYLVALRNLDNGRDWVFLAMFATFASDTSAFFVGSARGKRRLAPDVSPGKTWEGSIAGIVGAIIISLILLALLKLPISYPQAIMLGFMISLFGQLGDLVKSLLKRNMGVKDSGKGLPGHGGYLDRLDSVIFAGVLVYYYVLALSNGWIK